MKKELYGFKDTKAGVFIDTIFFALNKDVAIRQASAYAARPESGFIHAYPKDYQLFKLAEFEEQTGDLKQKVDFIAEIGDIVNYGN